MIIVRSLALLFGFCAIVFSAESVFQGGRVHLGHFLLMFIGVLAVLAAFQRRD